MTLWKRELSFLPPPPRNKYITVFATNRINSEQETMDGKGKGMGEAGIGRRERSPEELGIRGKAGNGRQVTVNRKGMAKKGLVDKGRRDRQCRPQLFRLTFNVFVRSKLPKKNFCFRKYQFRLHFLLSEKDECGYVYTIVHVRPIQRKNGASVGSLSWEKYEISIVYFSGEYASCMYLVTVCHHTVNQANAFSKSPSHGLFLTCRREKILF
jgi:hypothetical protein